MRLKELLKCDVSAMGFTSAVLVNDEDSKVGKRNDFNWHFSASWLNFEALSGK